MNTATVSKEVERLLYFALNQGMIEELDVIPSRNALLDLLRLSEPCEKELGTEDLTSPVDILNNILDYAAEAGILADNTITYRDLLDAKIMGILMPRQSEVAKKFNADLENKGVEVATDNFYALSQASNYIRMDRIAKNLYWLVPTQYGSLEITINLSKPEKDPKEIAAAKSISQSNYPKCLLCIENVGFAGHLNHPARQNHRVIPVKVAGEQWYFQYSPYVYYNEHCILFHGKHVPMKMSGKTFERLFDFVEQFPHYFIGSNADLPIVGGSILTHEHFQGGRHVFPMAEAPAEIEYSHKDYSGVRAATVKWPMSVIRLSGMDKNQLIDFSVEILNKWREYSDESVEIAAYTKKDGNSIPHNTITPIVRMNKSGEYEIDLVLRNNRTSEEFPDGIFHPHQELHHVKKENIGLIEVMGLAVLPARLSIELKDIENILSNKCAVEPDSYDSSHPLKKHVTWINELIDAYGINNSKEKAKSIMEQEVGRKFLQVLSHAGVYKRDESGAAGFERFMNSVGFKRLS